MKIKESEKIDKYFDLARELKNRTMTEIPILLVTVPEGFEKRLEELEIRGRIETIQITVLLKSAIILRKLSSITI